jgi:hypothetical protein
MTGERTLNVKNFSALRLKKQALRSKSRKYKHFPIAENTDAEISAENPNAENRDLISIAENADAKIVAQKIIM